jgi:glycerol-3-phosphate O-acyltransferase
MDANRESHLRELLESALQTEGAYVAAEAARKVAEDSHEKARERAHRACIDLKGALGRNVIRYGDRLVSVSFENRLVIQHIESVQTVTPPVPVVVSPPPVPAPEQVKKPDAKPTTAPPLTKPTGPVPTLGKK